MRTKNLLDKYSLTSSEVLQFTFPEQDFTITFGFVDSFVSECPLNFILELSTHLLSKVSKYSYVRVSPSFAFSPIKDELCFCVHMTDSIGSVFTFDASSFSVS